MLCGTRAISARSVGICDGVPSTARSSLIENWHAVAYSGDLTRRSINFDDNSGIISSSSP